jgi:hypothetical protein
MNDLSQRVVISGQNQSFGSVGESLKLNKCQNTKVSENGDQIRNELEKKGNTSNSRHFGWREVLNRVSD